MPPPPPIRPLGPLMGTTEESYPGSNVFYYAFGGEPKPDWSGIKDPSSRLMSDLCYRHLDPVSGQKSTHYRIKGLSKPYDRTQKLSDFQKSIQEHLVKYGLDTIGYLPDPKDSSKAQSTVIYHARFTGDLDKALMASQNTKKKFDKWDRKHDYEARQFLLSSLSETVKEGFETFHENEDTFSATWLKLVHYLVTTTSKTYDEMKDSIRKLRPQQYPGQDVEKMATEYIRLAREIDNAGHYSHGLTLNMVDGFLCASHDAKGTFHHTMNSLREKVSSKEQETIFLPRDEQSKSFAQDKLSYKDVCLYAVKIYNELRSNNMWEPGKLPKDRHAPNINFTKAEILNLIESVNKKDFSKKTGTKARDNQKSNGCFNCGDPDHQIKDCPKPRPTQEQAKAKRHSNMAKWKLTAPKTNESKTKTVNGREFKWCAKCGNWTTTHDSDSHTGKSSGNNTRGRNQDNTAQTNLASWEPSAWIVEVEPKQTHQVSISPSPTMVIQYLYLVLTLAYFTIGSENLLNFLQAALELIASTWIHHHKQALATIAPVLWFLLGYVSCHITNYCKKVFNPITDTKIVPRTKRRSLQKNMKKNLNIKLKSASDHLLHPKYPLRLRNDNKFNPRSSTPTIHARRSLNFMNDVVNDRTSMNNLRLSCQCHNCTPTIHVRGSTTPSKVNQCKKGSNVNKSKKGNISKQQSSCQHSPHRKRTFYQPKGTQTARNQPNHNFTCKQYRKLQSSVNQILVLGAKYNDETKALAKRVASLSPSIFSIAMKMHAVTKESSFPIIWDTGASVCVTPTRTDFISYNNETDINEVKGLGGKVSSVIGQGYVIWSVHDTQGSLRHLKLKAYHIPNCKSRLISTNALLTSYKNEHITVDSVSLKLSGIENDSNRNPVIAFNNPVTHLPTTIAYHFNDSDKPAQALCNAVSTVNDHNANLTEAQKELLRWHQRLGHLAFKKIQHLMRTGVLSHTEGSRQLHTAASKIVHPPKCAACLFGKQTTRSAPGRKTSVVRDRAGILRAGNLLPGSEVSVDHFVSSVRGRLQQGYDKGSEDSRYTGGCIFIDHASSYIHVESQVSLSTHETLRAKMAFEHQCRDVGVVVQKYMSDNGTAFTSKDFSEHLSEFQQVSKLAGVGAHHHNAQAERAIRTIMSIARTMMIHAGIHWPEVAKASLWPMAVDQACYLFNHVPDPSTGLSPSDIFTKTRWAHKRFHDLHVWGCPVYVLDKSLQDGKKIPKWRPRSSRSIYMGVSKSHASSVPLVLNVSTGSITPQFHIVFDDWFATVPSFEGEIPDFTSNDWAKMFGDSKFQYVLDDEEEDASMSDLNETLEADQRTNSIGVSQEIQHPASPLPILEPPTDQLHSNEIKQQSTEIDPSEVRSNLPEVEHPRTETNGNESQSNTVPMPVTSSPTSSDNRIDNFTERKPKTSPRRSTRSTGQVKRLTYNHSSKSSKLASDISLAYVNLTQEAEEIIQPRSDAEIFLSSKSKNDPDLFSYEEAMKGEHRKEWIAAATKEISSLESLKCWEEVPMSKATTKVLPGTWVFRVKRAPDGTFKKFKARYCIRGDLQEGEFDTYAPVVSFSSVRLFLAWSLMLGWYTCTIDFSNAFIQANLEDPTFIHLPRGFQSSSGTHSCLSLKKSIYGLSVAPRLWFQHLLIALKEEGLQQSKHDPCLLYRKDLIVICYVDDLGLQVPHKRIVDQLISSLENKGFQLTREGSFTEYLGIQYDCLDNGKILMTQTGLIQKIIDAAGMLDCNSNRTPATREALGSDIDGEHMTESWNYRSIIGMMLYLSTNIHDLILHTLSAKLLDLVTFQRNLMLLLLKQ